MLQEDFESVEHAGCGRNCPAARQELPIGTRAAIALTRI